MRRRAFLFLAGLAAAGPFAALARGRIPRVGFLWIGTAETISGVTGGLEKRLAALGYTLGRDVIIDYRFAEGKPERLPALISELLASGADILLPQGNAAARAARQATASVPIVTIGDDLVDMGFAASLAHPGGNVTGIDVQAVDYRAKWLELLKAAAPNVRSVAVLADSDETPAVLKLEADAPRFGMTAIFLSSKPPDFDASLAAIASGGFDGLIVNDNPSNFPRTARIAAAAGKSRTPMFLGIGAPELVAMGAVLGSSFDFVDAGMRLADYVDKILKGEKPGDLPIQRPTKFLTVVNLKAARSLGLTIPPEVLTIAAQVIE